MIAYGVCVRSQDFYERVCLPSIAAYGGESATVLTVTDTTQSAGYNDIIEAAASLTDLEALVLLGDDVSIEDPEWTTKIHRAITEGTDVGGVIGASDGTGLEWWTWKRRRGGLRTRHGEVRHSRGVTTVDVVDGRCLILSPRAVSALRFDAENFPGEHGSDLDLCLQATDSGFHVQVLDLDIASHGEGKSDHGPDYLAAATRFQAKWAERIGHRAVVETRRTRGLEITDGAAETVAPSGESEANSSSEIRAAGTKDESAAPTDYYDFARPELVALVPQTARTVLDVGCASGALGAGIKRMIPACEVSGIEYVQSVVDQAATRLDQAWQADLNGPISLPVGADYFDVMIFGDVLEHLLDPTESLRRLLPYLAPGGVVIASIPNVKHWSVMIPALAEDLWEYTDAGLLDRTHVHLFTLRESMRLFREVGLRITHAGANRIPIEPSSKLDPLVTAAVAYGAEAHTVRELLTCYQFLLVADYSGMA